MNLETKKMDLTVEKFELPKIETNFKEIKTQLEEVLKKYEGLVFTKENMQGGKDTRAELNKLKKLFEDKRKKIKKKFLSPYDEFEIKVKELVALIEKPIGTIDTQIKTFENDKKEKKKINIGDVYDNLIGDLKEIIPLDKIFNEKWLNATKTIKSINDEIFLILEKSRTDLKTIGDLKSEFELQIKDNYLNNFDLSEALAVKTHLEKRKEQLKESEKNLEKAKKEVEQETINTNVEQIKKVLKEGVDCIKNDEQLYSFIIKLTTTNSKKDLLKKFLLDNSITYEVI